MKRLLLAACCALASFGTACYDRPTCSFKCGEDDNACPYEYYCAPDNRCKLKGVEPDYVCEADEGHADADVDAEPSADADTGGDAN